jgi:rhomboid protease GluP
MKQNPVLYKIRHLFLPVAIGSVALATGYSFLNWLLIAKTNLLAIDEEVVELWLPLAIAGLLVVALIRPRLQALKLNETRNIRPLYNFAAIAIIAAPAMVAQGYIRTASGEITHVDRTSLIATSPETKYYAADNICLVRDKAIVRPTAEVVGKQNEGLKFDLYVVVPVCADGLVDQGYLPIWIGLKYEKSISNLLGEGEKQAAYRDFLNRSDASFRAENPAKYAYFAREGQNSDRRNFEKAFQERGINLPSSQIILAPHIEPFEQRTGQRLQWIFYSAGIATVVWFVMVLVPPLVPSRPSRHGKRRDQASPVNLLIPRREFYGVQVLLLLNVGVFLTMVLGGLGFISFQSDDLVSWGANYRPMDHGFGIFRLVTSQFIHGGLFHLVNNLYGLLVAGFLVAPAVRNSRLIFCYLATGLGGSVASVAVHPATVSVGASGSILGLWGILLTLVLLRDARIVVLQTVILVNAAVFVGLTLIVGAVGQGIDNAAHIGGLLTGALLGVLIFFRDRYRAPQLKLSA